jgi:outer membrane protein TolC
LVRGLDVSKEWWALFRSRPLTDLILRDNHNLKAAQAALRAAHANYEAQRGAFFPVVDASYLPSKQKVATRDFSSPTWSGLPFFRGNLFNIDFEHRACGYSRSIAAHADRIH